MFELGAGERGPGGSPDCGVSRGRNVQFGVRGARETGWTLLHLVGGKLPINSSSISIPKDLVGWLQAPWLLITCIHLGLISYPSEPNCCVMRFLSRSLYDAVLSRTKAEASLSGVGDSPAMGVRGLILGLIIQGYYSRCSSTSHLLFMIPETVHGID
jgi:hypothetical protein